MDHFENASTCFIGQGGQHAEDRDCVLCSSLTAVGLDSLVKVSPLIIFPGRRQSGQEASLLLKTACF